MHIIILCLCLLLHAITAKCQTFNEQQQVRKTLLAYINGRNNGDTALLHSAFHETAELRYMRNGLHNIRPVQNYIAGFTPGAKIDCMARIIYLDIHGDAAQAKIELEYPNRIYADYINLLKENGRWVITGKTYSSLPIDTLEERYVKGQTLVSKSNPKIEIRFNQDYTFVGKQSFILFENSQVTQFYFVKADASKKIKALYTVQFENYLPGIHETYNYKIKDSARLGNISFLHSPVYNELPKLLGNPVRSDVWHRFNFLKSKGYVLPEAVIGHRFVRLIDETKQKEILIIYNEDIKNTGATAAQLDRDKVKFAQVSGKLFKNALREFEILPDGDAMDAFIENTMAQQRITGLALGIIKDGKIIKTKGYGLANLEYNIPVTPNTVFKLASVSKHMVAVGIMKLVEAGKLKLDDPVTRFYNDAPAHWNKITIRHLLNHTSGLQRESPAFRNMLVQSDSLLIRAAYHDKLAFATGAGWQYCNLGYFMLADILRQTDGRSFARFMKEEIFNKNGLFKTQVTSLSDIVENRAYGSVRTGGDSVINAENNIALRPSGAFLSNIDDMLKWEMLIQSNQILSQNGWLQMWRDSVSTTITNTDGTPVYYGYGWNITTYKNRPLVFHTGGLQGFRTIYYRFPGEKTAIVILTNSEPTNTTPIAQGVADMLFAN